jgi:putative phosphoribosyl transferase
MAGVSQAQLDEAMAREQRELERREQVYREGRPPTELRGRTVILVDDGLATGATMRAAARAVRQQAPAQVVIAVPVAAAETCRELRPDVDEMVCVATPEPFWGVGMWYQDFAQTTDDEVRDLLSRAAEALRAV